MTCDTLRMKDGSFMHVCQRGKRRPKCQDCGKNPSTLQCDWALKGRKAGKTCSRNVCESCAHRAGTVTSITDGVRDVETIDYCRAHGELARKQEQELAR